MSTVFRCKLSHLMGSLAVCRWKSTEVRMVPLMKKLYLKYNNIKKKRRSKFDWAPINPMMDSSDDSRKPVISEGKRRRAEYIGKVLHDYITDLVHTGELSQYLVENGVEIKRVKVVGDISTMSVFWSANESANSKEIENVLRQNQGKLRHLLLSYHLLSRIPHITFVKDKVSNNVREVERLLNIVDFGPDFVPSHQRAKISSTPVDDRNVEDALSRLSVKYENENKSISSSEYNNYEMIDKYQDDMRNSDGSDHEVSCGNVQDNLYNINHDCDHVQSSFHKTNHSDQDNLCEVNNSDGHFRNTLYGINHTDMMKGLLIKKNKSKTRSSEDTAINKFPIDINNITPQQNYAKLAQSFKKPKIVKAKHLVQQFEQELLKEWNEERLVKENEILDELDVDLDDDKQ